MLKLVVRSGADYMPYTHTLCIMLGGFCLFVCFALVALSKFTVIEETVTIRHVLQPTLGLFSKANITWRWFQFFFGCQSSGQDLQNTLSTQLMGMKARLGKALDTSPSNRIQNFKGLSITPRGRERSLQLYSL